MAWTQPLTEISTRNISWKVKAAGASGWFYQFHVPFVMKSGSPNLMETSGPAQDCVVMALPVLVNISDELGYGT